MSEDTQAAGTESGAAPQQPPTADAAGKNSGAGEQGTQITFDAAQQEKVNSIVTERIARARQNWENERAALDAKTAEEAEAKRLLEQQKYKELAEKHQTTIGELTPRAEAADRYEAALKAILEQQRQGRSEGVLQLLDNLPPDEQLKWLAANPLEEDKKRKPPQTNASARSTGNPAERSTAEIEELAAAYGVKPEFWPKQ